MKRGFTTALLMAVALGSLNAKPIVDFNGDGKGDILWRSGSTNHVWNMAADGTHTYKNIGKKSSLYGVAGVADFNNDGITDILWRKGSGNYLWYMNSDGSHTYKNIGKKSTLYNISAVADFNGDGISDILWSKGDGKYLWYMNSDGSHTYKKITATTYSVEAVGDFNGDGIADLFLQKGDKYKIWLMDSNGGHTYVKYTKNDYVNGAVVGVGDFNKDGIDDLLWRDEVSIYGGDKSNHISLMKSDGTHDDDLYIGTKDLAYSVVEVNDIDGDGVSDIVWRKGSKLYLWLMNTDGTHRYKTAGTKSTKYKVKSNTIKQLFSFKFPSEFYKDIFLYRTYNNNSDSEYQAFASKFNFDLNKSFSVNDMYFNMCSKEFDREEYIKELTLVDGNWTNTTNKVFNPSSIIENNSIYKVGSHELTLDRVINISGKSIYGADNTIGDSIIPVNLMIDDNNESYYPNGSRVYIIKDRLLDYSYSLYYQLWDWENERNIANFDELFAYADGEPDVVAYGSSYANDSYERKLVFDSNATGQTNGNIVMLDDNGTVIKTVGNWEKITLPNSTIEAIKVSISSKYADKYNQKILYVIKDGLVYRGAWKAPGDTEKINLINKTAFLAVKSKIIEIFNSQDINCTEIALNHFEMRSDITDNTYNNAQASDFNLTTYYTVRSDLDENNSREVIVKSIDINATHVILTKVDSNETEVIPYELEDNAITIKDDNGNIITQVKFIRVLDADELNSATGIDGFTPFKDSDTGYLVYFKNNEEDGYHYKQSIWLNDSAKDSLAEALEPNEQ